MLIDDPDDPRVEPYRDIRERDLVGRRGLFIVEGETVLGHWLRHGGQPESVLIAQARRSKLEPLLERLPAETPVYLASRPVLDRIAGFPLHRGVLALGRRRSEPGAVQALLSLPERALVLALFGVSNHDNVGGVFRNAAAFGVDLVLLDSACCDPLYRKSIRVSVGAALTTPFSAGGCEGELIEALAGAGFDLLALSPSGDQEIGQVVARNRTVLLLGAEGRGLSPGVLSKATGVRIAMSPGLDSLNLAVSCGIALHSLHRPA